MPPKETGFAIVAIGGVLISTALMVVLHFLRQDLNPVSRYESEYAVGPYGLLMTLVFLGRGAAALALAWALYLSTQADWRSALGALMLGAFGLGMWLLALFPTDVQGAPDTATGAVHNWVALVAFVSVAAGALLLSSVLGNDPRGSSFAPVWWAVALLILASLLFFYAAPWLGIHGVSGLTERVFVGLVMLWALLLALHELEIVL